MTEKISDSESRELILRQLDCNIIVEAAAGTGKTTSIVGRMVNLIATGACRIENLVAVTFTRKAAAELRERFQSLLRSQADADRPAAEAARLNEAVDRIEHAFVGTFHSFCSSLLRERPIESKVDPGFRELEESEDLQIREQAWQSFLADLYAKEDNRLDRIYELGLNTDDLHRCYERFVEFPDVDRWPHKVPAELDVEALKALVRDYIDDMETVSVHFPDDRQTDKLMNRYEDIVRKSTHTNWEIKGEFFDLLELFDTSGGATLKYWHDKDIAKAQKGRFADFRAMVVTPALNWWYQHRYAFVIELLTQARCTCDQERRASRGLNYQDLLVVTAAAIKNQPRLREYFQRRFTHLLVDEFQDTDPVQAEVLAFLTSTDNTETNWQKCTPRSGALFLVGDPKQSIYRFRRADIVTYKQVKSLIEKSGGRVLPLTKNFRSNEQTRTWCNHVFASLFGSVETNYSPAAEGMEQGREDACSGECVGVKTLPIPGDYRRDEAKEYEAENMARYIKHSIESGMTIPRTQDQLAYGKTEAVEPGDFLIVTHRKRDLQVFAAALDKYEIANQITGSNVFGHIRELEVLIDCLRAIDDPRNPIPFVGLLRGDLFGFSDQELYELRRCGGIFNYSAPLPEGMADQLKAKYTDVNERLVKYLGWIRRLPYTSAVAKIAGDLGLLAATTIQRDGNILAGGFLKALEWLRSHSWDFDSATDMITFLDNLLSNSEAEGCAAMSKSGSVVRIMNLHKVKGLEAPVVFLANTFGNYSHTSWCHVDRTKSQAEGYMWITKPHGKYQRRPVAIPSDWEQYQSEEDRFLAAEDVRLLYVACTRAESQLVVSTTSANNVRFSRWQPLYPFLEEAEHIEVPETVESKSDASLAERDWPTLDECSQMIEQRWQTSCEPSYAVVAAKEVAMQDSKRPFWHATGDYGANWGSAIHRLLELRIKSQTIDLRRKAMQLADDFELGASRVEEMLAPVESVLASDIWNRAQSSETIYSEIPFESADVCDGIPTITRGVIDLVFEESGGWVIVDYKTDDIEESDIQRAVAYYLPQLSAYREFWTDVTGRQVAEVGLLFTKLGQYAVLEKE